MSSLHLPYLYILRENSKKFPTISDIFEWERKIEGTEVVEGQDQQEEEEEVA